MRALFVHQNFPAQYRHVAPALARRPGTQVIALGENAAEALPGVQHLRYKAPTTGRRGHPPLSPPARERRSSAASRSPAPPWR